MKVLTLAKICITLCSGQPSTIRNVRYAAGILYFEIEHIANNSHSLRRQKETSSLSMMNTDPDNTQIYIFSEIFCLKSRGITCFQVHKKPLKIQRIFFNGTKLHFYLS